MPKLKPARTAEEAALTPASEPVTIELTDPPIQVTAESTTSAVPEITRAEPRTEPEPEPINPLQKQLDDLKAAEALARSQAAEAERRAAESERQRAEALRIADERAQDAEQSSYNEVLNAIAAAKADGDKARTDFAIAAEAQDYAAMAEAQQRMSDASNIRLDYERQKNYIERQYEARKAQPQQQQQPAQPQLTIDQYIDTLHQLSPASKNWLKAHPDALTDRVKFSGLSWAHDKTVKAGIAVDSPEYFAALETELGYRQAAAEPEPAAEKRGTSMPVSAPVQRSAPSPSGGSVAPTRVELTPEQREAARFSGIDEVTYARNLLRLREAKANGQYGEYR